MNLSIQFVDGAISPWNILPCGVEKDKPFLDSLSSSGVRNVSNQRWDGPEAEKRKRKTSTAKESFTGYTAGKTRSLVQPGGQSLFQERKFTLETAVRRSATPCLVNKHYYGVPSFHNGTAYLLEVKSYLKSDDVLSFSNK